jgi:hypothetical protein
VRPHTLAILVLALATRLLILWFVAERFPHNWLYSRGIELGTLAQSLLAGTRTQLALRRIDRTDCASGSRLPCVIALVFRIFGAFTFTAAIAVMVMQILFSVLTVLLIMQVAQRCFDSRTADVAGMFWAVSLPLLWMPTIFWETCLSTLLLVGMIALALRCEQKPSEVLWALMGAYCGLAALVNPALLPALLALLGGRRGRRGRRFGIRLCWACWFSCWCSLRGQSGMHARCMLSFRCAARLDSNYGWETAPEQRAFWMNRIPTI